MTAVRVPRKDRLLDLTVDVGDERRPRRVVAGLSLAFAPEALVGKRVLVVLNLEPRDFGLGIVSEGMVLAAGQGEGLALATVPEDVPPGHAGEIGDALRSAIRVPLRAAGFVGHHPSRSSPASSPSARWPRTIAPATT